MRGRGKARRWVAVLLAASAFWRPARAAPPQTGDANQGTVASAATVEVCSRGYRRSGEMRDFALGRTWTIFASCVHPERPRVAVATGDTPGADAATPAGAGRPAAAEARRADVPRPGSASGLPGDVGAIEPVRPGGAVRLWKRDGIIRIDLAGVALGGGAPGAVIRVRVSPGGKVLRGTVRAAGSVELDAAAGTGFSGGTQ